MNDPELLTLFLDATDDLPDDAEKGLDAVLDHLARTSAEDMLPRRYWRERAQGVEARLAQAEKLLRGTVETLLAARLDDDAAPARAFLGENTE